MGSLLALLQERTPTHENCTIDGLCCIREVVGSHCGLGISMELLNGDNDPFKEAHKLHDIHKIEWSISFDIWIALTKKLNIIFANHLLFFKRTAANRGIWIKGMLSFNFLEGLWPLCWHSRQSRAWLLLTRPITLFKTSLPKIKVDSQHGSNPFMLVDSEDQRSIWLKMHYFPCSWHRLPPPHSIFLKLDLKAMSKNASFSRRHTAIVNVRKICPIYLNN